LTVKIPNKSISTLCIVQSTQFSLESQKTNTFYFSSL